MFAKDFLFVCLSGAISLFSLVVICCEFGRLITVLLTGGQLLVLAPFWVYETAEGVVVSYWYCIGLSCYEL